MKNRKYSAFLLLFALMTAILAARALPADAGYEPARPDPTRRYYYTRDLEFITSRPKTSAAATAAATPTPRATAHPAGTQKLTSASSAERQMLAWINEERQAQGLSPLLWSDELADAARSHSRDMAQGQYCSHTSPTAGGFSQRLRDSGIRSAGAGENVARYGDLAKAHAALMTSDGHRRNLLNSRYTHIGIGIVRDERGVYSITQWVAKLS